jgi:hypothetical protein
VKDVEELLRETLADQRRRLSPPLDLYETVRSRARSRRRAQWASGLSVLAVVAIAATSAAVGLTSGSPHVIRGMGPSGTAPTPASTTTAASPAIGTVGDDVGPVDGGAQSVQARDGEVWALFAEPSGSSATLWPVSGTPGRDTKVSAAGGSTGLAVDPAAKLVWTWSASGDVVRYDSSADGSSGGVSWDSGQIFDGTAIDGQLWLATTTGLYQVDGTRGMLVTKLSSVSGSVFGIAADPTGGRVLVGEDAPVSGSSADSLMRVDSINVSSGAVTEGAATLAIGKESIAVSDGQVWVAGYGSGSTPRIYHLDPKSLDPIGTSPVNAKVGPGSQVWPGQDVIWVRDGGDEQLACIDPSTGAVLEAWQNDVQGPVTSIRGHAYAVSNGTLVQLNLTGACTG